MLTVLLLPLLGACPAQPDPVYLPKPVLDADPYSELSRTVRLRNRAVAVDGYLDGRTADVRDALARVRAQGDSSERLQRLLDDLEERLDRSPPTWIDMSLVAWIGAVAHRQGRDTVLVQYGDITQHEIDREEAHFRALGLAANLRGYQLEKQDYVTTTAWQTRWEQRDVAGLVWRSEGWFSRFPEEAGPRRVMTRVWTSDRGEPKAQIFAESWAQVLPEGLTSIVMASCGTGGPFLDDEVNVLEQLGPPDQLTYDTFDTELYGHAVHLRTYRGLLATSGYTLDPLSWRSVTTLLPDRTDLAPDRVSVAQAEVLALLAGSSADRQLAQEALAAEPADVWIDRALASTDLADGMKNSLNWLSARFTGEAQSYDSADQWRQWWQSPVVRDLRDAATARRAAAPDEAELWARLKADFVALTGLWPMAQAGVSFAQGCWEAWFRCAYQQLSAGTLTGDDDEPVLTRVAPADTEPSGCWAAPLPLDWTVRYERQHHDLDHNLGEVLSNLSEADITAHCTNL